MVEFFCLVLNGFHWFALSIGLVDQGSVRDLSFGAFSVAFFLFLVCEIGIFLGFADFGSWFWGAVCGGTVLDPVPPLWGTLT